MDSEREIDEIFPEAMVEWRLRNVRVQEAIQRVS
jgi:hypothetical protein